MKFITLTDLVKDAETYVILTLPLLLQSILLSDLECFQQWGILCLQVMVEIAPIFWLGQRALALACPLVEQDSSLPLLASTA